MKKTFSLFVVGIVLVISCSKKQDDIIRTPPPTPTIAPIVLSKSTAYSDQSISTPKTNYLLTQLNLKSGKSTGKLKQVLFSFPNVSQANLNFLKNIRIMIAGPNINQISNPINPTPGENQTASADRYIDSNSTYKVEMYGDILSGFHGTIKPLVRVTYDQIDGSKVTDTVSGQSISFGSGSLSVSVSGTTPAAGITHANQTFETLVVEAKASGTTSVVNYFDVQLQDFNAVEAIDVYEGTTLLGSTASVSSSVTRVNFNASIDSAATKKFSVKVKLKPITSGARSQTGIKTSIVKIGYTTSFNEVKSYDVTLSGNDIVAFKAYPVIQRISVSEVMDTLNVQDVYALAITAVGGPVSLKGFTIRPALQDLGSHNDVLKIKNLGVRIVGNAGLTQASYIAHTDQTGLPITEILESTTEWNLTFATGNQKLIIPEGQTVTLYVTGKFSGFEHRTQDGDNAGFTLLLDAVSASASYRYVNNGTMASPRAKLSDTKITNSSAIAYFFIWSDMSANESNSFFGNSTDDHFNGARLQIPTTTQVLYRMGIQTHVRATMVQRIK